jgi:hypothetical protein
MPKTLTDHLVDWAIATYPLLMETPYTSLRVITARQLSLRRLQRECGHDGMKHIERDIWQCQCCGLLQRANAQRELHMPGTFLEDPPGGAVEAELVNWTPPGLAR